MRMSHDDVIALVKTMQTERAALVAVAEAAKHWEVCDFPDEVDFRCEGCNKARAAYAALAQVRKEQA
jgi:hypothetical protein